MKNKDAGFLFVLLIITNWCCTKNQADELITTDDLIEKALDDEPGICTELFAKDHSRAFGQKNLFWAKHQLRVRFMGGSTYVQNKVKYFASQWSQYANITFQFVDSEPSDIRISFNSKDGSWSYIGATNAYIASDRATMNFGWFSDQTSDTEFRRTTLHEFGHAVGLSHEHQHPEASINWNREAVYTYYQNTQDWSRGEVDRNIFQKYSISSTNYSDYDPQSVMHYYIPKSLVIGSWAPTSNTNLSAIDKQFIGKIYPLGNGTEPTESKLCNCPEDLSVIACEDYESYESQAGFNVSKNWKSWSSSASLGELQNYSWGKVLKIAHSPTANPDLLYLPGVLESGNYSIRWKMYVGEGSSAYFNIQKYEKPGQEYGAQFFFDNNKEGKVQANNRQANFTYSQDKWLNIQLDLNFVQDMISFSVDGQNIASWPAKWTATSGSGISQFGAINFFAIDEQSKFWLDDFCVSTGGFQNLTSFATSHFDQSAPSSNHSIVKQ
ncbi:MAG: hypothetical protein IPL46_20185 [Saprospiraceae bacterium]|nr:hypothetical protein [Saprospiraceae bacterium]